MTTTHQPSSALSAFSWRENREFFTVPGLIPKMTAAQIEQQRQSAVTNKGKALDTSGRRTVKVEPKPPSTIGHGQPQRKMALKAAI